MRSAANASQRTAEVRGISRFSCRMFPRVYGVCDRAASITASPFRQQRCGLRHILTSSAPRSSRSSRHGVQITRLNGRPASTPRNASSIASRPWTHDSGSSRLVGPSTYDSLIHDNLPVFTGAPKNQTLPGAEKPEGASHQRNGTSATTVLTEDGPLRIDIPRVREGCFDPVLIPKHERRFTGFNGKIIAMYTRGMTAREIQRFLTEQYGTEVSRDFISSVTDAVMGVVTA